jgi:hypothetical protein
MMILRTFTSMFGFKALLLGSVIALAWPGCAAPSDAGRAEEEVAAPGQAEAAGEAAPGLETEAFGGGADFTTCPWPPPYGAPVHVAKEEAFISCKASCVAAGHPSSGCHSGCCKKFTGCNICYMQ